MTKAPLIFMEEKNNITVLIIFGATAVGKTNFSIQVAKSVSSEIINGDIGQFYEPLTIGTAKPDWKNEPVAHHLFDIMDDPKDFSSYDYRELLISKVNEVSSRGNLPIIVGGSGFYLKSIFFPPFSFIKSYNQKDASEKKLDFPTKKLWEKLDKIDAERASQINKNDRYRIERAIEIWNQTGMKPSKLVPKYCPPMNFVLCYLDRDRQELMNRINIRTRQMVDEGWLSEARGLVGTKWEPFLYKKKLIGYNVLFDYLSEEQCERRLEESINTIQKLTRQYAKRQNTFWKSFKKHLNKEIDRNLNSPFSGQTEEINLTLYDRDLYIKQLIKKLRV